MKDMKKLLELLAERILFLDGAMGTMIQRYKLGKPITAASVLPTGPRISKVITTF